MLFTGRPALVAMALLSRWRPDRSARGASLILVVVSAFAASTDAKAANSAPNQLQDRKFEGKFEGKVPDGIVRIVFETALGDVEIAVETSRAPISAGNFLAYVDAGHYDGATIYRAARKSAPGPIGIVQGGLLAAAMAGTGGYLDRASSPFPPITHETTEATGIPNERGTLAWRAWSPARRHRSSSST